MGTRESELTSFMPAINATIEQMVFRDELIRLHQSLVQIPSINPSWGEGLTGPMYNEQRMSEAVAGYFAGTRCQIRTVEVSPGRPNVIVTLPGKDRDRRLLFETHMDTVTPSPSQENPFTPVIRNDAIWGLGSCDAKASLTSMMVALKQVANLPEPPPATIVLAAVVDEEYGFTGVKHLISEGFAASAAVVGEPTMLDIVIAHKGVLRFKVETIGKSAHGSNPSLGVNAVMSMTRVIETIERQIIPELISKKHPLLGSPTLNVGSIHGGLQANIVPDRCIIDIDRRVIPGENPNDIMRQFEHHMKRLQADDPDFSYVVHPPYLDDPSLETSADEEIVHAARRVTSTLFGVENTIGVPYGTDGSKLSKAGIPTIVLGPGDISVAHSAEEHVAISQLEKAVETYAGLMLSF